MANPTDSPRGAPAPYPTSSVPASTGSPSGLPAAETEKQREYQPLAILAIVGLGVAVLYALGMGIAAVIALSQARPLILAGAAGAVAMGIPMIGGVLALVAWIQVRRSEGTLGGRRLAVAAASICALVGLVYWSYYLATFLAMRQRADAVSREFLAEVGQGNLYTGFWYTLDPERRPSLPANAESDPAFRHMLEVRFNNPDQPAMTSLGGFEKRDEVHLLRQIGKEMQIESLGITSWDFNGEGYVLIQAYRLSSPEGSFELEIALQGKDAKHQEFAGRQWSVLPDKLKIRPDNSTLTEQGRRALGLRMESRSYIDQWLGLLALGRLEEAYMETRPVSERDRIAVLDCMLLATVPGSAASFSFFALRAATLESPGYKEFTEGSLVHVTPDRFWVQGLSKKAGEPGYKESLQKEQENVAKEVKAFFAHAGMDFVQAFKVNKGFMPLTHEDKGNGHFYVEHDFSLRLESIRILVEGLVVLECSEEDAAKGTPVWRIARLELLRAQKGTDPGRGMRGPPGMPGAGP